MKYIVYLFLFISVSSLAKEKKWGKCKKYFSTTSKELTVNNAAISMPSVPINGQIHPGFSVGYLKPLKKFAWLKYGLDFGYFFQKGLQSAVYVAPHLSATSKIYKKIFLKYGFYTGPLMAKTYNPEFVKQNNGSYKKTSDWHMQAWSGVYLEPKYKFYTSKKYEWFIGTRYQFNMQYPFSAISTLLPITQIHLTLTLKPYFLL